MLSSKILPDKNYIMDKKILLIVIIVNSGK